MKANYEIRLVNHFDGIDWFGVFVDKRLVWTGCKDSCESYAELLDIRARVHPWKQFTTVRQRAGRWVNRSGHVVRGGPADVSEGAEADS